MQLTRNTLPKACAAVLIAFNTLNGVTVRGDGQPTAIVEQAEDSSIKLGAADAKINGPNARLEGGSDKDIIWWTNVDTTLHWTLKVKKPGNYRVQLNYCLIASNNGSPLTIAVGDQTIKAIPKAGTGINDYRIGDAGEVTISKPGDLEVVIKPALKRHEFVVDIRSITLIPAGTSTPALDISGAAIQQAEDGSFKLTAGDAEIDGMNALLEQPEGVAEKDIGRWNDLDTSLAWKINVRKPGQYRVELNYALNPPSEGSKVAIAVGNQKLIARPKATKGWSYFEAGTAGEVTITKAGDLQVVLSAVARHYWVMAVRSVSLRPAETPTQAIDISDKPIKQSADGSLKLNPTDAEIDGSTFKLEGAEKKYIVWWNTGEGFIRWPIKIDKPGAFKVRLTYSLATNNNSRIETIVGGQKLTNTVAPSGGLDDSLTTTLGEVTLGKSNNLDVVMSSKSTTENGLVMYLRSVSLIPSTRSKGM